MKALKLSALTVVLLSTAAFAEDQAQVVTKEAQGEAAIVKGDLAKAKKDATDQALREAVVQAAGLYLSSDTVTQNSLLVSDKIYANAQGYVKNYAVTSEKQ